MTQPILRDAIYRRRAFDAEIIELCIRWYISYRLSYRDLVEMMAERGVQVAHTTILRWVLRYAPEYEKRWNRFARPVGTSWRVDETYVSIRGRWHYLYRAVDKHGKTIDFFLRRDRGIAASLAFFFAKRSRPSLRVFRERSRSMVTCRVGAQLLAASSRAALLAKRRGPNEPLSEQRHRARPSRDQAPVRIDGGLQVIRHRCGNHCWHRTRASNSQESSFNERQTSPSDRTCGPTNSGVEIGVVWPSIRRCIEPPAVVT